MNRRTFLSTTTAGLVLPALAGYTLGNVGSSPRRVGVIGCGWYGKTALFRLLQIEPVEVVALCDVDSKALSETAGIVSQKIYSVSVTSTAS